MKWLAALAVFTAPVIAFALDTIYLTPGQSFRLSPDKRVMCLPPEEPPQMVNVCHVMGAGPYNNFNYSFRVAVDDRILEGAFPLSSAIDSARKLEAGGVCKIVPRHACQLLGSGSYNNFNYAFRVAVGHEVLTGEFSQSSALDTLKTLKSANLCY